ncbi:MAG TPA: alanine racemase [Alphaproteobacteria bacterium]|nr:alanine racemase [Alphaproteobacteria bacterium]
MASDISRDAYPSQSVLTIDLTAVAQNYRNLRRRAEKSGADCASVIKADGYGLGAVKVAPVLYAAGCRWFYVAHFSEAVAVRAALPRSGGAEIGVLNGLFPGEAGEYASHGLIPVLNDLGQIEQWSKAARAEGKARPAIVHFDTGMSRLGLSPDEAARLVAEPERLSGLEIKYWLSHLACADEPDHALNHEQLGRIKTITARLPRAPVSFANSSGIFLGAEYHFDQCRPGCALYGINPVPGQPNPMRQVARLDAKVLQLRTIDRPQTVGYGATHRVGGPTRVATIAAGYADGWLRSLSNRGFALFGGVKLPFIGRVSMDLITIDATAVPQLQPGDFVELMGSTLTPDHVAEVAGTIGYEVLTRLGGRLHRRYVNGPMAASV